MSQCRFDLTPKCHIMCNESHLLKYSAEISLSLRLRIFRKHSHGPRQIEVQEWRGRALLMDLRGTISRKWHILPSLEVRIVRAGLAAFIMISSSLNSEGLRFRQAAFRNYCSKRKIQATLSLIVMRTYRSSSLRRDGRISRVRLISGIRRGDLWRVRLIVGSLWRVNVGSLILQ